MGAPCCSLLSASPAQSHRLGRLLGTCAEPGDVVVLTGELGSGKTVIAKGAAEALGIAPDTVTSPTFTLMQSYAGRLPLYHFDLYRLEPGASLLQLGFDEWFEGDGLSLIEWGEGFISQLADPPLILCLSPLDAGRRIEIRATGGRARALAEALCAKVADWDQAGAGGAGQGDAR